MLIYGNPDILDGPSGPLAVVSGLGYLDPTPAWWGMSPLQQFNRDLVEGMPRWPDDAYYGPMTSTDARWTAVSRQLLDHWKRMLANYPGSTWDDIANGYKVSLSLVESFVRRVNQSAFPVIQRIMSSPYADDLIRRQALRVYVETFHLTPWEWAAATGLSEAQAAALIDVPAPVLSSVLWTTPAVQATASRPGWVMDISNGSIGIIPAGSDAFTDAVIYLADNIGGVGGFRLTFGAWNFAKYLPEFPNTRLWVSVPDESAPPINIPIREFDWLTAYRLWMLFMFPPTPTDALGVNRNMNRTLLIAFARERGWSEQDVAYIVGVTVPTLRQYIDLTSDVTFAVAETRTVEATSTQLQTLTEPPPSTDYLPPVTKVFYFQFPSNFSTYTAEEKARYYLMLLSQGYTDAQIRITAESTFGVQSDADWQALQAIAAAIQAMDAASTAQAAALQVTTSTTATDTQVATVQAAANTATLHAEDAQTAAATAVASVEAGDTQTVTLATVTAQESAAAATNAAETAVQSSGSAATTVVTSTATGVSMLTVPNDLPNRTEVQKIAWYRAALAAGNADATIRAAVEAKFGAIPNADWAYLQSKAATPAATTGGGAAAGGGAGLLIAAAAAYLLLG